MIKRITIDGHVKDLALIYRWAQNIVDNWVSIEGCWAIHNDLNYLVRLLGGIDWKEIVKGYNDINEVDFDGNQLYIEVEANDDLQGLKSWLEQRFPWSVILIIENEDD